MEIVGKQQLKKGLALFLVFWGAAIGLQVAHTMLIHISYEFWAKSLSAKYLFYVKPALSLAIIVACATLGYFLASTVMKVFSFSMSLIDNITYKLTWQELSSAALGLVVGLVVANLMSLPLWDIPFGKYLTVILNLICGAVGATVFFQRQKEVQSVRTSEDIGHTWEPNSPTSVRREAIRKILDTSVIVDGRVLDVARTGFLDGTLVIPEFVLHELQGIADSSDPLRRMRGRRGLDVVNELQNLAGVSVEISQPSVKDLGSESVDGALLALGKQMHAAVLTTDYNLLKVAQIHDVSVLNINDLANAIKPLLLPGDFIQIDVIREGKDTSQGVGYLDDGTMCVVEDGSPFIGQRVEIMVTSMLQTSAGRMIFGRTRKENAKE